MSNPPRPSTPEAHLGTSRPLTPYVAVTGAGVIQVLGLASFAVGQWQLGFYMLANTVLLLGVAWFVWWSDRAIARWRDRMLNRFAEKFDA